MAPKKQNLDPQTAAELCRGFVPLCDQMFQLMDGMRDLGFSSFDPHLEYLASFCRGPEEEVLHRRCLVEKAKNWIGRPWHPLRNPDDAKFMYSSPVIEELARELERENGVSFSKLYDEFPGEVWRDEVDPCERKEIRFSIHDPLKYKLSKEEYEEKMRNKFVEEAKQKSAEFFQYQSFYPIEREICLKNVMEKHTESFGFTYDKKLSRKGHAIFSKNINNDWKLCWTTKSPERIYNVRNEGACHLSLQVRGSNLTGDISRADYKEWLEINYKSLIPGMFAAYQKFKSLAELETIIIAHIALYSLVCLEIEGQIFEVFGNNRE